MEGWLPAMLPGRLPARLAVWLPARDALRALWSVTAMVRTSEAMLPLR